MKIPIKPLLMVLGSMVLAFFLWTLVSALGGSAVSRRAEQPIQLPRLEEIGQVLPGSPPSVQPVSPVGHRQELSAVSGTRVSDSSRVSSSGGSLVPSPQEVRKLQEEGGVIY